VSSGWACVVYLLHFDRPYKHAKHYIGMTTITAARRIERHRLGDGARLLQVVKAAGIGFTCARVWRCHSTTEAWTLERQLKQRSATRHCPICRRGGESPEKA
jgi:predicted GIY-YIG superfamily endonuclease